MQLDDREPFRKLLADVMAFYRQDVSTFALGVWWEACGLFGLEQVRKAMTAHAMDPERGQFAPKPADVVRQLQGTHTDRALVAWAKVHDAIRRVGSYQSVEFNDHCIHGAIEDIGGWQAICADKEDNLPFLQRRFCDSYRTRLRRPDMPNPPRLLGRHEERNRLNGFPVAEPERIGHTPARLQLVQTKPMMPETP